MPKPIVVIYFAEPDLADIATARNVQEIMEERLREDYHVIVCPVSSHIQDRAIELKVFHEKDFTDIQYEELKQLIEKSLTEIKVK